MPAPAAPVPIAISAHNCVPRLDARGVSLSLSFSEGLADCISFVSPAPAPAAARDRPRRSARRPDPEALALAAYERVISLAPRPEIGLAPARVGLTGLDSFFWVADELRPISATARAPGLTVTAEARPVRYLWDFGDGSEASTNHPGRPWTRKRPGNVAHLYETKARYSPRVETIWAARWRSNGGPWRALGYFSTTGSASYPVREVVATLVRGR
ncbi:MAG: PKD domain-containing protein [Actinomycetota bacterium]|nr:PKD domain-containing protein [Actinomycetota bacterium]